MEAAQAARPGARAGMAEAEAETPEALDDSRAQEQVVDSKAGGLATYWEPCWGTERSSIRPGDVSSERKPGRASLSAGARCAATTQKAELGNANEAHNAACRTELDTPQGP